MARYFEPYTPIANATLVSRYVVNATVNVNAGGAGTYTDFGGTFTTTITTKAGDQVHLMVQSIYRKAVAGQTSIVIDRSGTKLPGGGASSSTFLDTAGVTKPDGPFCLEVWDAPAAGTYTYKPQIWNSDANAANVGDGAFCQFLVEIWR